LVDSVLADMVAEPMADMVAQPMVAQPMRLVDSVHPWLADMAELEQLAQLADMVAMELRLSQQHPLSPQQLLLSQ
jgi:hypothetical protein